MYIFAVFPGLFFLTPLTATLLRVAAALVFGYVVWAQLERRKEFAAFRFPLVGAGEWIVWVAVVIEAAIALALFAGLYTQPAAILAAIASLKFAYWSTRAPAFAPLARGTCFLLLVISLSLIITGAGAFAFDLPL